MDWENEFAKVGAFWFHDGNPKRPYAELTGGEYSNGYFNSEKVAKHAKLFGIACEALAMKSGVAVFCDSYAIGAEKGAVKFAGRLAETLDCLTAWAEKQGEALAFTRADFEGEDDLLLAEDVVTTGKTLKKLQKAAMEASPGSVFNPTILALCNRSEHASELGDSITFPPHRIIALVNRPMPKWKPGHNPFTPDGAELVPPLRPKGRENWAALNRAYH